MRTLEDELLEQLRTLGPTAHLLALSDMAELDDELRSAVQERFAGNTHPLLQDSAWQALRPYSPLLLAADSADSQGHRRLAGAFNGKLRNALHGWIISTVPPTQLTQHLARAMIAHGLDGATYLLRCYDPWVLPVLYRQAPSNWWREFIAPIASWWVPRADTQIQRWGRIPGLAAAHANPPPPLVIDEPLWQALIGDPLPHRLLQAVEAQAPDLLDNPCRGIRLARIEALLEKAREAGLSAHDDLHDYVFLALARGTADLEADHRWQQAVRVAASGTSRLGDLYVAYHRR
ncbi:TPA: DUF4123 domain-containing protein [Pseudomonas aeruginosa]|uniref:DUF4123 domain-containing protein n=1 Tax=Pseudomonas aeruginosa TaxID=287 RepID=UPI0019068C58|nr:DUF4123 domain-containing protein [Pseudomonas aeruginosa]MDI2464336.1 DUF4123 domain-containing protein [Pseudomonas aeruginosa]QQM10897.1 DUF4123 domain-containing protein [Pseudomonas aeruginosa]HBO4315520.1 DUF4123 domain-containing protein [Pseudomonas aeruginosa]HBO4704091.1 DUF4123 domain-containing protein [Pseudomonas aeruginosa]HCF4401566.1 DUF4123 domain-containing protein [Pseudomonas aeruginosa]